MSTHHDRSQQTRLSVLVDNNATILELEQDENQYVDQEAFDGYDDLVSVADSAINDYSDINNHPAINNHPGINNIPATNEHPGAQRDWKHQCKYSITLFYTYKYY